MAGNSSIGRAVLKKRGSSNILREELRLYFCWNRSTTSYFFSISGSETSTFMKS